MTAERKQFLEEGKIASGLDVADGFIHLSDLTGPRVVAKLFFTEGEWVMWRGWVGRWAGG